MAGLLIVVEGPEGAGKSTQLRRLAAALGAAGRDHMVVREPGGTPVGDEIRRLLLDPGSEIAPAAEAMLFMASRAQLVEQVVRPALDRGAVVLVDRFFLSTYAYQVHGRGLPLEGVRDANRLAVAGLVPDLTLLLSLPADEGLARAARRGEIDRMERSGADFHERVAAAFARFATSTWQEEHPECGPIVTVEATGDEEVVAERILTALRRRWPETFALGIGSDHAVSRSQPAVRASE